MQVRLVVQLSVLLPPIPPHLSEVSELLAYEKDLSPSLSCQGAHFSFLLLICSPLKTQQILPNPLEQQRCFPNEYDLQRCLTVKRSKRMSSAAHPVLSMPKLLQIILLELPVREILVNAQRGHRDFRDTRKLTPPPAEALLAPDTD
jgi:hypothetical protein